ncbi:MAG: hypothetical protein K0U78_02975, partial [Actinomycetia bacterium]|nr:hypothetical protein [Actinomycetes bacterium]
GDDALLFGPGTQGEPTAQDWAELLGTINYEIVTSPRGRIVRSYHRGREEQRGHRGREEQRGHRGREEQRGYSGGGSR